MNESGRGRECGCEGSLGWLLRVTVVMLSRDSFLSLVFLLLHRGWHQELLQKDWLQITGPVHGQNASIMPHQPTLMQCPPWPELETPDVE